MSVRTQQHIKHKSWKQVANTRYGLYTDVVDGLYDDVDEIPKHQSMKQSAQFGNSSWVAKDRYCAYDSGKWKQLSRKMNSFLKANIGRSYNKVYSEFKSKFPEKFGPLVLAEEFNKRFLTDVKLDRHLRWRNEYWCYYVDDHGIIRNQYLDEMSKKPRVKDKTLIRQTAKKTMYRFSDWVFGDCQVLILVDSFLPKKYDHLLNRDTWFSEKELNDILFYFCRDGFLEALYNLRSLDWWKTNISYYGVRWKGDWDSKSQTYINKRYLLSADTMRAFLFVKKDVISGEFVESGSAEHRRYLADTSKTARSENRKRNKDMSERLDNLLHEIEYKRRHADDEKNIIDRDRLGFDEDSFKGEFYHGQKRKKRV